MKKIICSYFVGALFIGQVFSFDLNADTDERDKYVFPVMYDVTSTHQVDYDRLNDFLSQLIVAIGPSEHKPMSNAISETRTRLRAQANIEPSRLESNRIEYSNLTEDNINYLHYLKEGLERIPESVPLESMTKDSQLAYWLNLHNVTVTLVIAERYPITDVERLYSGEEKCVLFMGCHTVEPVLNTTELNIMGKSLTLGDLRHHILMNWDDPLVLYGLYMGYIGSPNLRLSAYNGRNVWRSLEDNATEFVNSVRGTYGRGKRLRVSGHYELGRHLFPDFENDLLAHLRRFGKRKVQKWVNRAPNVDVSIYNWGINDLHNGKPHDPFIYYEFSKRIAEKLERQSLDREALVEIEEVGAEYDVKPDGSSGPKDKTDGV